MQNVKMTTKGNKLTLEIDLAQTFGRSRTGKTIVIASSRGNAAVPDRPEVRVGLNVFAYPEA
jgi:hypothetical protein